MLCIECISRGRTPKDADFDVPVSDSDCEYCGVALAVLRARWLERARERAHELLTSGDPSVRTRAAELARELVGTAPVWEGGDTVSDLSHEVACRERNDASSCTPESAVNRTRYFAPPHATDGAAVRWWLDCAAEGLRPLVDVALRDGDLELARMLVLLLTSLYDLRAARSERWYWALSGGGVAGEGQ